MRIGILTYHCVPNFGAQLQATSTVGFIKRMGHDAVVLHWYPKDLEDMYAHRIPKEQIEVHNTYTRKFLPVTEICRSEDDLLREINRNGLDAIIVGSDALFKYIPLQHRRIFSKRKLRYVKRNVMSVETLEGNPFFGSFIELLEREIPVVAFSVSSQNCPYFKMNGEERQQMKNSIKHFSSITVRDEWTKDMVEDILGISGIQITPDPVFSFNQNCFINLPSKKEILSKYRLADKYLLLSFSSHFIKEKYIKYLAFEAERKGLMPVSFPMPEGLYCTDIERRITLPLDPLDWYALIKYSSGYIGERMHPIVVCLHNSVPFFSFDEYGTSKTILFGLINQYIRNSSKTYRILSRAGFTDWMFSYKMNNRLPSAKYILDKIKTFDISRCRNFAVNTHEYLDEAMSNLLKF